MSEETTTPKKTRKVAKVSTVKKTTTSDDVKSIVDSVNENIILNELNNRFLHVKVGSEDRPASAEDIELERSNIVEVLEKLNINNCGVYVSGHLISIDVY